MSRLSVSAAVLAVAGWAACPVQGADLVDTSAPVTLATEFNTSGSQSGHTYTPMIVVGDPGGTPPVTLGDKEDPNVPTSFAAGVVSVFTDEPPAGGSGFISTGTVISPYHILTAGHSVDGDNDGVVDVLVGSSSVVFNNTGTPITRGITAIDLHPNYTGFNNPSINDDLAILTLDSPIPVGVPIYSLSTAPFTTATSIVMVGYGTTGDGVNGFTGSADFFVKHFGQNIASTFITDDEGSGSREVWLMDFDGPDNTTDTLGDGLTLGNVFETTIGPGDSGGPSFIWNDDGDGIPEADEMTLFGTNTFGLGGGSIPVSPLFGSQAGGMIVSTYEPWIQSIIPEPASASLLAVALMLIKRRPKRSAC